MIPIFPRTLWLLALMIPPLLANAQDARMHITIGSARPLASNVLIPQARFAAAHPASPVRVTGVEAAVEVVEQVATTTLQISLSNPSTARQEAEVVVPVPEDVALRSFTFQQVNDRAFYRQGNRWVDSQLLDQPSPTPQRTVAVGSDEFRRLVAHLAEQNRQGCVALNGEILLRVDGETVLIK